MDSQMEQPFCKYSNSNESEDDAVGSMTDMSYEGSLTDHMTHEESYVGHIAGIL